MQRPMFSVNSYDYEGDVSDKGIFLHFGDSVRVHVAESLEEYDRLLEHLQHMRTEIAENCE